MSNSRNARSSSRRVLRGFGFVVASLACASTAGLAIGWSNHGAGATVLTGYGSSTRAQVPVRHESALSKRRKFQISGDIQGLFPGATVGFTLTVTNPEPFAITVKSLTTTVESASNSCAAANLSVSKFSGSLTVPARGQGTARLSATLSAGTTDACIGATFPLVYSGRAIKRSK
jgi:hypothetical protein